MTKKVEEERGKDEKIEAKKMKNIWVVYRRYNCKIRINRFLLCF